MNHEGIDIGKLVLYEDNHLLIVNKPPRLLSQTDKTGDSSIIELAAEYIRVKYDKPGDAFIRAVQRLDRPVSGCMILTRTSKATERMAKIIRDRNIKKVYHALTTIKPHQSSAHLEHYLRKNRKTNTVSVHKVEVADSKLAILDYSIINEVGDKTLLEVILKTGRPHQIRAQLSHIGSPVLGDFKYGSKFAQKDKSICLHSREVSFVHPVRKTELTVVAPYPDNPNWTDFS